MDLLIFLLTLSLLVFVHEAAHFLAAKRSGVEIDEFGFGLPPRLWGRKVGGTIYSLNLLPIGGFVRLKGESGEIMGFGDRGSFSRASRRNRSLIIVAGVLGNLLLAYFIFSLLFLVGYPGFSGHVIVEEVNGGSPAETAGLKGGDVVRFVDGQVVKGVDELVAVIDKKRGQSVGLVLERESQLVETEATPRLDPPSGQGPLGVRLGMKGGIAYEKPPIFLVPVRALVEVGRSLYLVVIGFYSMIRTLLAFDVPQGVTGIVGIYKLSSEAAGIDWRVFLQFVALLSVNLAVFNILPLPALDGGRLLFVFLEKIFRRRISAGIENAVNNLGLAFFILIFVLITLHDIQRFWG